MRSLRRWVAAVAALITAVCPIAVAPVMGLSAALALSSCTNGGTNADLVRVSTYANAIASGLKNVLPQLASVTGVSAGIMEKVSADVADIQAVAATLQTTSTANAAQPMVSRIEGDVSAVLGALAGIPLPSPIGQVIAAVNVLLPVIETIVGVVVPSGAANKAAAAHMTEAQALAVLGAR